LTFLVGRNAAGKSNFLDALQFLADSLRGSLDHAFRERGGVHEVRRRSTGHPHNIGLRVDFQLPDRRQGYYEFRIGARQGGAFEVIEEECVVDQFLGDPMVRYRVERNQIKDTTEATMPAVVSDRLLLVAASGVPAFRPVYDALCGIDVYSLNPESISRLQDPDRGVSLRKDGGNAASVFRQIEPPTREVIDSFLEQIVPGLSEAHVRMHGKMETIEFRQEVRGGGKPWRFPASTMSDGTLRAFGVLLAIFQGRGANGARQAPLLIGIEEPEVAVHPAALHVLLRALRQAARDRQIVVTSHSPELLDDPDIGSDQVLAVANDRGETRIGRVDLASRKAMRERLMTAGELLRDDQLTPDPDPNDGSPPSLFDEAAPE
jgi:predicted ATPase